MNIAILIFRKDLPHYLVDNEYSRNEYYETIFNYVYTELFGDVPGVREQWLFNNDYCFDERDIKYNRAKYFIEQATTSFTKGINIMPYYADERSWITNWTPDWKPPYNYDDNFDDTDDTEYDYQTILMRRDLPEEPNPLPRLFCFHCYTSHEYAACRNRCFFHENIPTTDNTLQYPQLRKRPMRFKRWTS